MIEVENIRHIEGLGLGPEGGEDPENWTPLERPLWPVVCSVAKALAYTALRYLWPRPL
jgi:hypothetical protein